MPSSDAQESQWYREERKMMLRFTKYLHESRCLFYRNFATNSHASVDYIQGQSPSPKVREYFYYIDHQGMVSNIL